MDCKSEVCRVESSVLSLYYFNQLVISVDKLSSLPCNVLAVRVLNGGMPKNT